MNIILIEQSELDGSTAVLSGARANHVRSVLKSTVGDTLRIGLVDGPKGTGTVRVLDQNNVTLECVLDQNIPPRPRVDLLLALPRPKVMKRLWAQLAAVGVGRVILTNAWKVERNYFDTHVLDPDHYRPLLLEGLQQAGDTLLPEVSIYKRFKVFMEDHVAALSAGNGRVVMHPGAGVPVAAAVESSRDARVLLAIGPEGGWTDYEMGMLRDRHFVCADMGPRILRTDTAVIAALALVSEALRLG
jgi:RsmE family RNA methyltransferase